MRRVRLAAFVALTAAAACEKNAQSAAKSAQPPRIVLADTARGVVSVVGNEPVSAVLLSFGADVAPLALVGDPSARQLRAMAGIEVVVSGRRTTEIDRMASPRGAAVFRVEHFVVRAVDGVAAEDGELVSTPVGFVLRRADGKELKIGSLPPVLRSHVGARVYLAGPLDRAVVAYGVIAR